MEAKPHGYGAYKAQVWASNLSGAMDGEIAAVVTKILPIKTWKFSVVEVYFLMRLRAENKLRPH